MDNKRDYPTYEVIEEHIRRARIERSVAVGNFIAGIVHGAIQGLVGVGHLLQRGTQPAPRRPSLET